LESVGQVVLAPVQVSATSHSFTAARQTAPAFPAGCEHVALVPLQTSLVQGLLSGVQAVPLGWKRLVGQVALDPVQVSAKSHPPAAVRQTVLLDAKPSAGQLVLTPSQVSAMSHTPTTARQTVPAWPAGCWQL